MERILSQCRILEQLATSPKPRYFVSGHTDDGLGNRHAQPEMETPMAEKLPALPSQLFGSPAPDVMAYLEKFKASQPGAVQSNLPITG